MSADLHLQTMNLVKKFPMNILRPSNAYGPGQQVWRIIPKAILYGLTGKKLPLEGGGSEKSYLYVDDLSEATHLVLTGSKNGEIYNAGPEKPNSIRDIIQIVAEELNIEFSDLCEEVPGRVGEDSQYWLDSSKIKNDFSWEAKNKFERRNKNDRLG